MTFSQSCSALFRNSIHHIIKSNTPHVYFTQIDDMETLRFAREEDLRTAAGLKVGDVIKIRKILQENSVCLALDDSTIELESTSASDRSSCDTSNENGKLVEEVRNFPPKMSGV